MVNEFSGFALKSENSCICIVAHQGFKPASAITHLLYKQILPTVALTQPDSPYQTRRYRQYEPLS